MRKDGSGKDLEFGSSRRPAACLFELTNNNAAPDKQDLWVVAFHNADGKSVKTLQNALSDCFSACDAVRGTTPLIIGSDTNLDYNNPENADFYKGIFGATGYEVGITDGVGTSLLAKVNGDGAVAGKAFDNIFTKGLTSYAGKDPEVINVIEDIANEMQLKPPKGKKRTKSEDLNAGFNEYATKKSKVDGDDVIGPGGISDHLPVAGVFRFT